MKTFWITGASSGIGEALARELGRAGHSLILSARNAPKLEALRASMPDPARVHVLPFDLAETARSEEIASKAIAISGGVDTVILNAGLSQRALVRESGLDAYRRLMEVNYFGNVALTRALLPHFEARASGHFVVVSSLVGKFGTPYRSGYSASKHALHGFYDSLRAELMAEGRPIDVTLICPGFVATEISFNALGASGEAAGVRDSANANGLNPDEFAKRAIRAMHARKYEVLIGGKETLGVLMKRFAPGLFARMIARARVR